VTVAAVGRRVAHLSPDSDLARGVVVEASLLARLLGLKLLTLEGTVVLSPARVDDGLTSRSTPVNGTRDPAIVALPSSHASADAPVGSRLAAAEQLLADCGETLNDLRKG
jgi:hypothetical protein